MIVFQAAVTIVAQMHVAIHPITRLQSALL